MTNVHQQRIDRLLDMLDDKQPEVFLLFALAKEYDAIGDAQKAITHYRELLLQDPNYLGAYYHLAELLHRSNDTDQAHQVASAGIALAKKLNEQKDLAELLELAGGF